MPVSKHLRPITKATERLDKFFSQIFLDCAGSFKPIKGNEKQLFDLRNPHSNYAYFDGLNTEPFTEALEAIFDFANPHDKSNGKTYVMPLELFAFLVNTHLVRDGWPSYYTSRQIRFLISHLPFYITSLAGMRELKITRNRQLMVEIPWKLQIPFPKTKEEPFPYLLTTILKKSMPLLYSYMLPIVVLESLRLFGDEGDARIKRKYELAYFDIA